MESLLFAIAVWPQIFYLAWPQIFVSIFENLA